MTPTEAALADPALPAIAPPADLRGAPAFAAMLGICLVTMLVAFDQTVVGTALPRIVADLKGFALYSWVATAYLLMSTIFVPIMGRLGDLFGRKRFVLASIVLFTAASALCGLAQSMIELVLARALQGVGGGMLVGTAFAATADIFPDQMRRIRWQAMLSSAFGLANAIGPSLGGWLTEHWGWRSVFYVNLPVGIAALSVVARYLPSRSGHRDTNTRIDWFGAIVLASAIAMLLTALEEGAKGSLDALLQPACWLPALAAIALTVWLLRIERRVPQPMLPLRLFEIAAVRQLAMIGVASGWAMFTLIFYAPLLLQAGFGLAPNRAGLLISPVVVCISVGSIINGRLYGRMPRPHRLISLGISLFLAGCICMIAVSPNASGWVIAGAFAIGGLGLGFQLPNLTIQMQAAVERRDIGVASALVQSVRMMGSMIGAAIAGVIVNAVFARRMATAFAYAPPGLQSLAPKLHDPQILVNPVQQANAIALAQQSGNGNAFIDLIQAARLALIDGVHSALWLSVGLCVIALILSQRLRLPEVNMRVNRP